MQPVVHMAKRPQQVQPCLCEVESGIQGVFELLSFVDLGQLLCLRCQLWG